MASLIDRAINLVIIHHKDQLYNEYPYAVHPIALAMEFFDKELQIIALLHDIVEDTPVDIGYIRLAFGDVIANAIDSITRRKDEAYMDYIKRCKKNVVAKIVKVKDLHYHLAHMDEAPANKQHLKERYYEALRELHDESDEE